MKCHSMNRTVTLPALPAPLPARTSAPHRASGPRQNFRTAGHPAEIVGLKYQTLVIIVIIVDDYSDYKTIKTGDYSGILW